MRLQDQVAVVTGGGGGIGGETCRLLAAEGAAVVVADLVAENCQAMAAALQAEGHTAIAITTDVADLDAAHALIQGAVSRFSRVDILANIAGGSAGPVIRSKHGLFADSSMERWDEILALNLYGTLNCTRAVINHMIERGRGKVVNFASIAGILGMQKAAEYSAAKGGVLSFTRALAKEVAAYGINVNCVSPGVIRTVRVSRMPPDTVQGWLEGIPLRRLGTPKEVARVVLFLASSDSDYITGENISVAGGMTLGPAGY